MQSIISSINQPVYHQTETIHEPIIFRMDFCGISLKSHHSNVGDNKQCDRMSQNVMISTISFFYGDSLAIKFDVKLLEIEVSQCDEFSMSLTEYFVHHFSFNRSKRRNECAEIVHSFLFTVFIKYFNEPIF